MDHIFDTAIIISRGTIVNRTYCTHKKLCIYLFLLDNFGPIYPVIVISGMYQVLLLYLVRYLYVVRNRNVAPARKPYLEDMCSCSFYKNNACGEFCSILSASVSDFVPVQTGLSY